MGIFKPSKGGGGGGGVAFDGDYADPVDLGSGKSEVAPGKQRLAADQTWTDPLEHFSESWDETYKVAALTGREDPDDAEATVDIALVPKGNGGIQAAIPDGTATGGNARGTNAVDLQISRNANTQVASAQYSTIGGGMSNTASGIRSTVAGGNTNSATSTYTTVCGGINNQASDIGATVGGGDGNIASNNYAVVSGGTDNTASGNNSTVGGGTGNSASASQGTVSGGASNTASGFWSSVGGGDSNTASTSYAVVPGGQYASASLQGQMALAGGRFTAAGDAQQSWLTSRNSTTDATQTELFLNGSSLRIAVPSGSRFRFRVDVICTNETDNTANGYEIKGVIKNIAGTTSLVGTNSTTAWEDDAAFDCVVEADDTNDALVIKVTGAAGKTCRWVASTHLVQVT